ncbi:MAG: hypothetical protein NDI61_06855 [Bdellovibrionaceae bacterium]|nr:hypothetical protein [Pseudobdellovibrionaceae bacterium]
MNRIIYWVGASVLALSVSGLWGLRKAEAARPLLTIKPNGLGVYAKSGVIVGGTTGAGFSIVRAARSKSQDGAERLTIVFGDVRGKVAKSGPGYFHVQVDEQQPRVSIDFAQVQTTAVDPAQLQKLFRNSPLVAGTDMTMDPIDFSTNITLQLRRPAEVRANIVEQNGAQFLAIDLRPSGRRP